MPAKPPSRCVWTRGLPELSCTGSIRENIERGAHMFKMEVPTAVVESIGVVQGTRIAVLDPESWRAEGTIFQILSQDAVDTVLVLQPAGFECPTCEGAGCARCDDTGHVPPHAIKGEWWVPGLGVVAKPGKYQTLDHKNKVMAVEAQWRPCDD